MAQYRAVIQGSRGATSRLGGKNGGIRAEVNGWHRGIRVVAEQHDRKGDGKKQDRFIIYITGGSNSGGFSGSDQLLAVVYEDGFVDNTRRSGENAC